MNLVILSGYVGSDPEMRTLSMGKIKARFSLATTRIFKGKDGQMKKTTHWRRIVAWGSMWPRGKRSW